MNVLRNNDVQSKLRANDTPEPNLCQTILALWEFPEMRAIAASIAKLGDKEKASSLLADAIKTAEPISDDGSKADALSAIAASYAKLAESSSDRTLYDKTLGFIEGFRDDGSRDNILDVILSSKLSVADVSKLRSLTTHYGIGGPGKARALPLARILRACSHPELIGMKEEAYDDNDW